MNVLHHNSPIQWVGPPARWSTECQHRWAGVVRARDIPHASLRASFCSPILLSAIICKVWPLVFRPHTNRAPFLVFTKLASQLNADKLADLAVIPFIFLAQTLVSWCAAQLMARIWGFSRTDKTRQKNFILAMGVFGNSNSLPISLVISLSKTISGLHWDKVPGDNDDEVAARGILYLLIFQQLGQLLRWTWGYSVLLKPEEDYTLEERGLEQESVEEGRYTDEPGRENGIHRANGNAKIVNSEYGSGSQTAASSSLSSLSEEDRPEFVGAAPLQPDMSSSPRQSMSNGNSNGGIGRQRSTGHITTFPTYSSIASSKSQDPREGWRGYIDRVTIPITTAYLKTMSTISTFFSNSFRRFPEPVQKTLAWIWSWIAGFMRGVWRQMNPPLWAMLAALIVASIPALQHLFFAPHTFVSNSVTRAIAQSGGVAVPLILVVLGANLARSTLPQDQLATTPEAKKEERKLLYACLMARMLIPTIIMAPILAVIAKYVPVSILDDPIFVIVAFLLTGAPSALQLAQICQINGVFMGAMSSLLVASYVFAIFPSTLALVMLALEVVEWAQQGSL